MGWLTAVAPEAAMSHPFSLKARHPGAEPLSVRKILFLSVGLSCLAATLFAASPAGAATTDSAAEQRFLSLLNMARAGSNKPMLVLDGAASNVSRNWSNQMASSANLRHNPNYGTEITRYVTSQWTLAGENVGVGGSADSLHKAFWNSLGHRHNMLGDFNRVGIGAVTSGDRLWVTFNFIKAPAISGATGVSDCSATPGYVLDAFGGIHSVGGAPAISNPSGYWSGWDISRDLSLDSTRRGFKLDGFGGLYPVGGAPRVASGGYWRGWDIAVSVATLPGAQGAYVLDAFGGIHAAGAAPKVSPSGYWPGWRIARDIQVNPALPSSGYVLDGFGGLHPFGGAPAARTSGYWNADVARSFVFSSDGTGGYVVDANGGMWPFSVGNSSAPPAKTQLTSIEPATAKFALVSGSSAAVITASGARLGLGALCATSAPWGSWNIVRAAVSAG